MISLHNRVCQHQVPTVATTLSPYPNVEDWYRIGGTINGNPTFCGSKDTASSVTNSALDRCVEYDVTSGWQQLSTTLLQPRYKTGFYQLNTTHI